MEDDQRRQLADALLKVVVIAVGVGAVIAIVVFVMVKALGLGEGPPAAHATAEPDTPLPTTALTTSGSPTPSAEPRATATSKPKRKPARSKDKIKLTATPGKVGPGERINLTGTYPGADNLALQVQRQENGAWVSFAGVQAQVRVGTFATYVLTSRTGVMKFRVFDPTAEAASNAVAVTVG